MDLIIIPAGSFLKALLLKLWFYLLFFLKVLLLKPLLYLFFSKLLLFFRKLSKAPTSLCDAAEFQLINEGNSIRQDLHSHQGSFKIKLLEP